MTHDCFDVASAIWRRDGSCMYCSCGRLMYQGLHTDEQWNRIARLLYEAAKGRDSKAEQ